MQWVGLLAVCEHVSDLCRLAGALHSSDERKAHTRPHVCARSTFWGDKKPHLWSTVLYITTTSYN